MKPNELRINNRVIVDGEILVVESIDNFGINKSSNLYFEVNYYNGYFDTEITNNSRNSAIKVVNIEPIPLTEEWLLKFGFKNYLDGGYSSDEAERVIYSLNGFQISIEEDGLIYEWIEVEDNYYSCKGKEFKFVHKLQNFYYESKDQELIIQK